MAATLLLGLTALAALPALALTKSELNFALGKALGNGDLSMAASLLGQGADPNACWLGCTRTLVDSALDARNVDALKLLAKHGANVNLVPTPDGTQGSWKPLVPAFEAMAPKGMKLRTGDPVRAAFVSLGGNISATNDAGNTWLMESLPAGTAYFGDVNDALAFLAAHRFAWNATNKAGETAIILYAKANCGADQADVVRFIVAHGGKTAAKDATGHTARDYATLNDCAPMLAALK
jgi:ankyrin repeat protein